MTLTKFNYWYSDYSGRILFSKIGVNVRMKIIVSNKNFINNDWSEYSSVTVKGLTFIMSVYKALFPF